MNIHLLRLFVVAGSALALTLSSALINQDTFTPSAHAQSKNKKKAKSFRGPSSLGTSNRQSSRQRSRSRSLSGSRNSRSSSRSRTGFSGNLGIRSNRNSNSRSFRNDGSFGRNQSIFSSGRSRSSSPFSSNRNRGRSYGRNNNSLGLVIGLSALGLGNSNGYSSRRRYNSQPYGWRRHGWRSSSWTAPYYEPPSYRKPHSLWGQSHYHDTWGWYYSDIVNQSTLVFVDREPDNCDYIEYQDDILLECDKVLYRPSSYKGQKIFEIVDDY